MRRDGFEPSYLPRCLALPRKNPTAGNSYRIAFRNSTPLRSLPILVPYLAQEDCRCGEQFCPRFSRCRFLWGGFLWGGASRLWRKAPRPTLFTSAGWTPLPELALRETMLWGLITFAVLPNSATGPARSPWATTTKTEAFSPAILLRRSTSIARRRSRATRSPVGSPDGSIFSAVPCITL